MKATLEGEAPSLVSLRHVEKRYRTAGGEFFALRDVSVDVPAGQLVVVTGKSGSGKSTLLNMVAGIDRPSAGQVWVADTAVHALSEDRLALFRGAHVGVVFQFFQLLPTLTVAENVMLPMDFVGKVPWRQRRGRALELLDRVEVVEQADKLPTALSGGQQQRVAIARALANDPDLIVADEPTGNLDSKTARVIIDLLVQLAATGKTVLFITHERDIDLDRARTLQLADGRLVFDSSEPRPSEGAWSCTA